MRQLDRLEQRLIGPLFAAAIQRLGDKISCQVFNSTALHIPYLIFSLCEQ